MTEEHIRMILAENKFLQAELRKLKALLDDTVRTNQDLKYQLIELHNTLKLKKEIDDIDDGRC
jgi:hypothetical protein